MRCLVRHPFLVLGLVGLASGCSYELLLGRDASGPGTAAAVGGLGGQRAQQGPVGVGGPGGGFGALPPQGRSQCALIFGLPQAPQMDGVLEQGLFLEFVEPVGWNSVEGEELPRDYSMSYAIGWRPDGLYFFVDVVDPDRNPPPVGAQSWHGDGVELYVDHDGILDAPPPEYSETGTRQITIMSPESDTEAGTRSEIRIYTVGWNGPDDSRWISVPTKTGYIVEAFVIAEDLDLTEWTLAQGGEVGFDLGLNVSHPPGTTGSRDNLMGSYFLKIREPAQGGIDDYPTRNESAFCRAQLN